MKPDKSTISVTERAEYIYELITLYMKRIFTAVMALIISLAIYAQPKDVKLHFTEGYDLNLIGKIIDTPNPYHRVDTERYKGFTEGEIKQLKSSSGLAIAFKTNSRIITVKTDYGYRNRNVNTMGIALRGYDLYIKNAEGEWTYAIAKAPQENAENKNLVLIRDMDQSMKECLLYLPLYSEEFSVKIGTEKDSEIVPLEAPFRHRVGIFGSSYTQGISCSRPGMTYPAQFTRNTGIQLLSLGCSGNCKLQDYFATVLCDADVDAFIFDSFSNPSPEQVKERLFPFIETLQKAHPGIPLIFQQTIYREGRNFSNATDKYEQSKIDLVESMMKEACKKYKDVYFIHPNASNDRQDTSVDGIHPDNHGYYLWAKSIEKPVLKILKKYGIK